MTVSVKLYLPDGTVRRFPLEEGKPMNELKQKIISMHPELQGYDLCWKDSEGDMIALLAQDDLAEGLRHVENDIFRIYATMRGQAPPSVASTPREAPEGFTFVAAPQPAEEPMQQEKQDTAQQETAPKEPTPENLEEDRGNEKEGQDDQANGHGAFRTWREAKRAAREAFQRQQEENPDLHIGVTCDGCEGEVRGIRYKCATCRDYDLCEKCESEKKHPEHPLIKIATPAQGYDMRRANFRHMRQFFRHPPAPAWGPPPFGPAFFGGPHFAHGGPMRGGCRHWSRCSRDCKQEGNSKESGAWRAPPGFNAQEWNQWFSGISEEVRANIPPPPPLNTSAAVWNDWLKGLIQGFQNMSTGHTGESTGEGTSADAKKEEAPKTEEEKSREAAYLYQVGDQIAAILRGFGIDVDVGVEERFTNTQDASQKTDDAKDASKDKNETPVKEPAGQEPMETCDKQPSPVRETEWTFVHNDAPAAPVEENAAAAGENAAATAAGASEGIYPNVQKEAEEARAEENLSPKVATALQHMLNMGFTNDGGWLTALLVNKDGDISAVLDVLQRANRG